MAGKKILIANRGEIAVRVARTCSALGIEPCGIYSDADASSLHLKYCKETIGIGGSLPSESYLRMDRIVAAAKKLGCELVHPGYGFLAENYEFARMCEDEGLVFVGPSPATLMLSGDKAKAREVASAVAPILPGREVRAEDDAAQLAASIGYPVMLKAVKGGGGRGLRVVRSQEEIGSAFASSANEALMSFGAGRIYVEKYLENPRHIEVQVLGDGSNLVHLGERECSIQRRHQKLIEETPSPALTAGLREQMAGTAIKIMEKVGYTSAGTVEFLFKGGRFYFMEVNSRIQVEHPITEQVTGIDIVGQQLRIALGEGLSVKQDDIRPRGHAIECRINAEHPLNFAPSPGRVTRFLPPPPAAGGSVTAGADVRVDTALYAGYSIPPFYDSLVAKLICSAKDRAGAIEKMISALASFRISGVPTTIPFHLSALRDPRFISGEYDTSFVDGLEYFSPRDGEEAAAILSQLLPRKRIRFQKKEERASDPWLASRFDGIVQAHDAIQRGYLHGGSSRWQSR
ncbi:biotin carboxylase N-terminal domain-containing protein [Nitrososphaera sp.]|uniref:acetyl-CoA carboxylase biotin carboxylase subunit n=1 Tax=Nitrososphaera sp. TaxID=1971748 RepID=UPI00307E7804